jgi:hypothetical protein
MIFVACIFSYGYSFFYWFPFINDAIAIAIFCVYYYIITIYVFAYIKDNHSFYQLFYMTET